MIKLKEVTPEIYHIECKTDEVMFKCFLRYSEFVEGSSKKTYKKDFTFAQALIEYKKDSGLDYRDVNVAYNFSLINLQNAIKGLSNFTPEEIFVQYILEYLIKKSKNEFKYLVVTSAEEEHKMVPLEALHQSREKFRKLKLQYREGKENFD